MKDVIVAGAGYAGLLAANRLAGKLPGRARVILVSATDTFTDRIRLHEAAARGRRVEHDLSELLDARVERRCACVVGVEPGARLLHLGGAEGPSSLHYDALVLALGSRPAATVRADSRHALALGSAGSARELYADLARLPRGARVAIVGGGLTAIELSAEIAEAHPRHQVELLTDELAAHLSESARCALRAALASAGVSIQTGCKVAALEAEGVLLADGTRRPADVSVLSCGFEPAPLGERFALPRRADGRLPVDAQLRVLGLDDVFAVGDLAAPPAETVGSGRGTTRMACATALPLGAHAADQVVRLLERAPLLPYRFSYAVQCISVGRRRGVIASVDADDRATGRVLSGRTGALVKELICRFVLGAIRLERLLPGLYTWPGRRNRVLLPRPVARLPG